ncbi:uncharacterized protein PHACADRAFT_190878 [Phanerochaete carnosa HHB-10118-sp]|uniref:Uncharacterized protein n=1 Tax=Phanerochaete carnosa (strain HHB-10118-sp) TaxID=650164 RepID=K5WCK2_PHACS|nr:uncharacterized protein PHACADRAFT_190878 [Phanerochaete carnosa HHB-10118-sp]EKM61698.1 hypothetical protein PHACADRAFT_190878 [Phanerochaete carnosa HHB-10118-sp]
MAFHKNLVAVVEPGRLPLYALEPDGSFTSDLDPDIMYFEDRVSSAALEYSRECASRAKCTHSGRCPPSALHVALCDKNGLHVYVIALQTTGGEYTPVHRWSSRNVLERRRYCKTFTLAPSFGSECRSVSYIAESGSNEGYFTLMTTLLPAICDTRTSDEAVAMSAKLTGANMPALYFAPVRDFDDALGLLVVGNAFGELVLFSFDNAAHLQRFAGYL